MSRKIIYLFDSATSITSLELVEFLKKRHELEIEAIGIIDDSMIVSNSWEQYLDKLYVIKGQQKIDDPCVLNSSAIVNKINHEFDSKKEIAIVSYGEYTSIVAAELRNIFNISGPSIDEVMPFRNKVLMKDIISKLVRTPKYTIFDKDQYTQDKKNYLSKLISEVDLPFIIKPINAASALGTEIIYTENQLDKIDHALNQYPGDFEAEQFIDGELFNCEIVFKEGIPVISFVTKFNYPVLALREKKAVGGIPLLDDDEKSIAIKDFCMTALSNFKNLNGITHTEILWQKTTNKIYFLETACRAPGGKVIQSYLDTFGVNLLNLDQRIKGNLPIKKPIAHTSRYTAWAVIPTQKGIICKFNQLNICSSYKITWNYSLGDEAIDCDNFEHILGTIYLENENYHALVSDFNKIDSLNYVEIKNEKNNTISV